VCTIGDTCTGGLCKAGETVLPCNDGNPCSNDVCDPSLGCVYSANSAGCEDGNACTTSDTCSEGLCEPGSATDCTDGNACTDDGCNPTTGCAYTSNTATCDDGSVCTIGDRCSDGVCTAGTSTLDCNDANICTNDGCNADTGCVWTASSPQACDDGNACTSGDVCSSGACGGGASVTCNDGKVCTTDSCDTGAGCVFTNLPSGTTCNDGDPDTDNDKCNGSGTCVGSSTSYVVGYEESGQTFGNCWHLCRIDASSAWVAQCSGACGPYNATAICQQLGFGGVTAQGGTCGTVCGYCGNNNEHYDGGGGSHSSMTCTVHWKCQ
jgi:hypothetical protein